MRHTITWQRYIFHLTHIASTFAQYLLIWLQLHCRTKSKGNICLAVKKEAIAFWLGGAAHFSVKAKCNDLLLSKWVVVVFWLCQHYINVLQCLLLKKCGIKHNTTSSRSYKGEQVLGQNLGCWPNIWPLWPSKREVFTQYCFNVGQASSTLAQHWNSIGEHPGVCRDPCRDHATHAVGTHGIVDQSLIQV